MSDQAVLFPKWFSKKRIILSKGQFDHSYTFWTMPVRIFSPGATFGNHPFVCTMYVLSPTWSHSHCTWNVLTLDRIYVGSRILLLLHILFPLKSTKGYCWQLKSSYLIPRWTLEEVRLKAYEKNDCVITMKGLYGWQTHHQILSYYR